MLAYRTLWVRVGHLLQHLEHTYQPGMVCRSCLSELSNWGCHSEQGNGKAKQVRCRARQLSHTMLPPIKPCGELRVSWFRSAIAVFQRPSSPIDSVPVLQSLVIFATIPKSHCVESAMVEGAISQRQTRTNRVPCYASKRSSGTSFSMSSKTL